MDATVPRDIDEADECSRAIPGRHPAQRMRTDLLAPPGFGEHRPVEGIGVDRLELIVGEGSAPGVVDRHAPIFARSAAPGPRPWAHHDGGPHGRQGHHAGWVAHPPPLRRRFHVGDRRCRDRRPDLDPRGLDPAPNARQAACPHPRGRVLVRARRADRRPRRRCGHRDRPDRVLVDQAALGATCARNLASSRRGSSRS